MHDKKSLRVALIGAFVFGVATVGASAAIHEVQAANLSFTPAEIDVEVGDTVRWVWVSGIHTVTSGDNCVPSGLFDAPLSSASPLFEFTFNAPGDVPYFCIPHCGLGMVGLVRVGQSTSVEEGEEGEEGGEFGLSVGTGVITAAPNPFESATTLRFNLPEEQWVRLVILDASGRMVAAPANGLRAAGAHSVEWNGRTQTGTAAVSGTYFARLETAAGAVTRSLLLLR